MTEGQWIADYLRSVDGEVVGRCHAACKAMMLDFPGLALIRGHVRFTGGDPLEENRVWPHWWLADAAGRIVDPTASQFPGILTYEPWDESGPTPTGKCPNCGGYCYHGRHVCSDKCSEEYLAYLNEGRGGGHDE